jgi:hypothetical protein
VKLVAKSFERYNGGVRAKRLYGSSTITRFYVFRPEDHGDPNKWVIVETGGPSPGERATAAKTKGEEMLRAKGILAGSGFGLPQLAPLDDRKRRILVAGIGITAATMISILLLSTPRILRAGRAASAGGGPLPVIAGIRPEFVALAAKWAAAYGLPLQWVLATILSESNGNPNEVGDYHVDPLGASIGLMQVNAVAHRDELARAGLDRNSLFNPDTNIEWGTKILFKCVQRAQGAFGRPGSFDNQVGLLARLCYTGGVRSGTDTASCSSCPTTARNWNANLRRVAVA